jgi:hypothetical protein
MISKNTYVGNPIFYDKNYCYVERKKSIVTLDCPQYAGVTILDISKDFMYDFHYNHIKKLYGNNADTDSFYYYIKCEDVYESK